MKTFKKIIIWLIIMAIVFIGGEYFMKYIIETNYKSIEYKVEKNNLVDIGVMESKATAVNGYVKIDITNISKEKIEKTYIILEGFSAYNNDLVKEYVEINSLELNQVQEAQINFKADKVEKVVLYQVDDIEKEENRNIDLDNGFNTLKDTFIMTLLTYTCIF